MNSNKQSGFTLIEAAIIIVTASILVVGAGKLLLPYVSYSELNTTKIKEENISQALATFAQTYGRLPCPADPNASDALFGTPRNSGPNGTDVATNVGCNGGTGNYRGILPYKALGLNEAQAKDSYGNFFTYAVNPGMVQFNFSNQNANKVQAACGSAAWRDGTFKIKNRPKANVCCPLVSSPGDLNIVDRLGSAKSVFNPGPTDPTPAVDDSIPKTPTDVKIIPYQYSDSGELRRDSGICNSNNSILLYYNKPSGKDCYYGGNDHPFWASSWNSNAVMVARYKGPGDNGEADENGHPIHKFAMLKAVDFNTGADLPVGTVASVTVDLAGNETPFIESRQMGSKVSYNQVLPANDPFTKYDQYRNRTGTVMVGREHRGDENAYTSNRTAYVSINGNSTEIYGKVTSDPIPERNIQWASPPDPEMVMIDRMHYRTSSHDGDDSDYSGYLWGKLKGKVDVPDTNPPTKPINRMIAFVLVSHGKNGDGAYMKGAGQKTVTAVGNAQESANYANSLNFVNTNYSMSDDANYFDDVVLYKTNDQLVTMFDNNSCTGPQ